MAHLDPDRLILLATGETRSTADDADHLAACSTCRAELDDTRTVVALGRGGASLRDLPEPSPGLWDRIAAEAFGPARQPGRDTTRRPVPRRVVLALAAAACVAVGAFGATGIRALLTGEGADAVRVLARTELVAQPGTPSTAHGTAQIVDTGHGTVLEVSVDGVPPTAGYYTVWLYDGHDVMIPLGSPGTGALNVPASADLATFRIVDVSAQRMGQQEHGRSVLQGRLP